MSEPRRFQLTVRKGPLPGKVFELAKSVLTIGREVKNDIVINDSEVSRQHVRLTEQEGGWQAEDLASTNGTFINGQRLTGPALLRHGDLLGMGETVQLEYTEVRTGDATQMAGQPEGGLSLPAAAGPQIGSEVPAFSLPASTPPAEAPAKSGAGVPVWAWAVGGGCVLVALCGCLLVAALVILAPALGGFSFGP